MANDATKGLNRLIETCLDGQHGFEQAAQHVSDPQLKAQFSQYAQQRAGYVNELQTTVRAQGGTPTESGSVAAGLHRAWIGLKDALSKGDRAIVAECIRGDESAVKQYQEAMSDDDVPPDVKTVLARQHGAIEQVLAKLNAMAR